MGWVTSTGSFFYPPDAAHGGVDLAALVVIRVLHAASIPVAGEKLLRSGGFGLIVLDLGTADIPMPLQSRSDRARPAPPRSLGLPYREGEQDIFAGIAGFIAGSCRADNGVPITVLLVGSGFSKTSGTDRPGVMRSFAMVRLACVDLPAFPLQLLLRRHPEWASYPAAVVAEDKPQGLILWVNEKGQATRCAAGSALCRGSFSRGGSSRR